MKNGRYNAGVDSTVRVNGDRELCELLHHVPVPNGDCHFDSNVWQYSGQRAAYEMAILGGCPTWQYKDGAEIGNCRDDHKTTSVGCDHFGSTLDRDDPQTRGIFEGKPIECGLQTDESGWYIAGFFIIPHCTPGHGCAVRACLPKAQGNDATCGPWLEAYWRK